MLNRMLKGMVVSIILAIVTIILILYLAPRFISEDELVFQANKHLSLLIGKPVQTQGVAVTLFPNVTVAISSIKIDEGEKAIELKKAKIFIDAMAFLVARDLESSYSIRYKEAGFNGRLNAKKITNFFDEGTTVDLSIAQPFAFKASGDLKLAVGSLALSNFAIALDETSGVFNVKLKNEGSTSTVQGKIDFSLLDIAEINHVIERINYLIAGGKDVPESPKVITEDAQKLEQEVTSHAQWNTVPYAFKWLRHNWDVDVFIKELRHKRYQAGVVSAHVEGVKNQMTAIIKSSEFFGGDVDVALKINKEDGVYAIEKAIKVKDVAIGKIIKSFANIHRLEGVGDVDVLLTSRGINEDEMVKNSDGKVTVRMLNGAFLGVDVAQLADSSEEHIKEVLKEQGNDTEILALNGSAVIQKGILTVNDLLIEMPFGQKLYAEGDLNIHGKTLNMKVTPALKAVVGLKLPLKITGNIYDPSIFIDPLSTVIDNVDQLEILQAKPVKKVLEGVKKLGGGLIGGLGKAGLSVMKGAVSPFANKDDEGEDKVVDEVVDGEQSDRAEISVASDASSVEVVTDNIQTENISEDVMSSDVEAQPEVKQVLPAISEDVTTSDAVTTIVPPAMVGMKDAVENADDILAEDIRMDDVAEDSSAENSVEDTGEEVGELLP